ncbi:glycosyltransferase family 4 protein [Xylanimonas protaetiae]|uniref:Glycosyltransferase n=1 Tax=Xylanimonas protaetiae TaxID=2509457 RepID=A0A4P6F492_9MICO|nr:glycosyltransferase family 4 protein [Xylanimonas protaetiae]QAY69029.1 glycosyltransferase [Xylanimonas protaetiae]
MRIVHVVVSSAFAGVEAHVSRLARAQAAAGNQVVVVGGDVERMADAAGPDVRVVPGATLRSARSALARLTARADVAHAHMTAAELVACTVWPVVAGRVPLVSTRHFAQHRGRTTLGRLTAPVVARVIAAQIAIAQYTAERIDGPSTVVLAGVDARPDRTTPTSRPGVVLMAQRLEAEKRADLGVRAFAASGLADLGWRLLVAGDGAERPAVEALVAELGLAAAVTLLGRRSDVADLMAGADVFLAPTPGEHFGLSVLEAMAAGLPVVADGSGGHLETLGTDAAGLYPSQDPGRAGTVLRDLATDAAAAHAYGAGLQVRQRTHFSLDQQVTATDLVYRSVLV